MLCGLTQPTRIPYFNAPIYLQNKTQIGKIDEILGPINEVYFTVKMDQGMMATSFKKDDKVYIGGDKLLPIERFLPKPAIKGAPKESESSPLVTGQSGSPKQELTSSQRRKAEQPAHEGEGEAAHPDGADGASRAEVLAAGADSEAGSAVIEVDVVGRAAGSLVGAAVGSRGEAVGAGSAAGAGANKRLLGAALLVILREDVLVLLHRYKLSIYSSSPTSNSWVQPHP